MPSNHGQDHKIKSLTTTALSQDDMAEELPLDLNPGITTMPTNNALLPPKSASFDTPNSNRPAVTDRGASILQMIRDQALAQSQIPPRPKPPVPSTFFIHPKRSWRSMSKDEIRAHIVDRFAVRLRFTAAYNDWEEQHNKWAFGVYHLMRAVTKSQQITTPDSIEAMAEDNTDVADAEDAATVVDDAEFGSLAATEFDSAVLREMDLDGTALTVLQTGADADELDRAKRWFMSQYKHWGEPTPQSFLLPSLQRHGPKGSFGLSAECRSPQPRRTPSIELPESAARKLQSNVTPATSPEQVADREDTGSDDSASESEEERDENSFSWRIYSDECPCGYADCHCRSWSRWWNKTLDMLAYVEYADIPIPSYSGDPLDLTPQLARIRLVGPPSPVEDIYPVCSLNEARDERSRPCRRSADHTRHSIPGPPYFGPDLRFFKRILVEEWRSDVHESQPESREVVGSPNEPSHDEHTLSDHDESANPSEAGLLKGGFNLELGSDDRDCKSLASQTSPGHRPSSHHSALKLQWEGFMEDDPKVPTEYLDPMITVITQELEPYYMPDRGALNTHWRARNRLVHWIACVQYSCCLSPEIFFLAVNLLDRYLTHTSQPPYGSRYDTLGVACLWSAWKYEDTSTPVASLDTLLMYVEPGKVFRNEVIYAEWTLHQVMRHNLSYVGPVVTMRIDLMATESTKEIAYIARFLIEISMTEWLLVSGRPSMNGSAAVWLARELMGVPGYNEDITPTVTYQSRFLLAEAAALVRAVLTMPCPLNDSRDHALFFKWTQPVVNNLAGWCQEALRRAWPEGSAFVNDFEPRLLVLRGLIQDKTIPRFQLGPGPSPDHPLFEPCAYNTFPLDSSH